MVLRIRLDRFDHQIRFIASVAFARDAAVGVWLCGVGFGEVMRAIIAVSGMVEHREDRARAVLRPREQRTVIGAEVGHREGQRRSVGSTASTSTINLDRGRVAAPWTVERLPALQSLRLFRSTHGQGECHTMAQGRSARTRGARYRQRVGAGGCSGIRRCASTAPATPSAAASGDRQHQQQSSGERDHCRLPPAYSGLVPTPDRPGHRRQNQASINRPLRPGDKGGTGGSGRGRGDADRRRGGSNGDGDIGCRTPSRCRVRRNRAGGLGGSPGTGKAHRPGHSPFTAHT